ncbi:ArsR/SmtB family transcription factor [Nesterenkonia marinintestina]|uniref:ArsR/SmtB family transcription factor n=1 Tax=Nesterenkonia marinintestina TaxID=2979865 RepID=UPI0021C1F26D|nr:metalloregulator ArsR/SmtB family transcription factor [Nesterenkonia sp. GX14115]
MNADIEEFDSTHSTEYVDLAAEVLRVLSDATRIRLVLALREIEELSVNALAERVGKTPSGVSQHLAKLRMTRVVTTRHEGTRVLYRLVDEHALRVVSEAMRQAEHAVAHGQVPPHHRARSL